MRDTVLTLLTRIAYVCDDSVGIGLAAMPADAPLFDELFGGSEQRIGSRFSGICAFGFEPNPQHTRRLQALEKCYDARAAWR